MPGRVPPSRGDQAQRVEKPAIEPKGDSMDGAVDVISGADELAIPVVLLIVLVALLFATSFVIYLAPGLFAELLVDGL